MGLWIVGLCLVGKIVNVIQDGFDVRLQCLQRVWKVLSMESLLGAFVIGFARRVELSGRVLVIFPENAVKENVPHFGRNVSSLCAEKQILEIVPKLFDFLLQVHGLAKDGGRVIVEKSVLGKEWGGVGWITEGNGELGSSLNVVDGSGHEISITVKSDHSVGVGSVVELLYSEKSSVVSRQILFQNNINGISHRSSK